MKRKNLLMSTLCLLVLVVCAVGLSSCGKKCVHEWGEWDVIEEATCVAQGTKTRTCGKCGEIDESKIGETSCDWVAATCTAPRKCKNCLATVGTAEGHFYTNDVVAEKALKSPANCSSGAIYYKSCDCGAVSKSDKETFVYSAGGLGDHSLEVATCEAPQSCKFCDLTVGDPLDHDWKGATCIRPETCATCRTTRGEALGHKFVGGTCVEKKVCSLCNIKEATAPGHIFGAASCACRKSCLGCGVVEGDKLEHRVNGVDDTECTYCEENPAK